jgi:hypothetical protein
LNWALRTRRLEKFGPGRIGDKGRETKKQKKLRAALNTFPELRAAGEEQILFHCLPNLEMSPTPGMSRMYSVLQNIAVEVLGMEHTIR